LLANVIPRTVKVSGFMNLRFEFVMKSIDLDP
jgi:hypothetical protein